MAIGKSKSSPTSHDMKELVEGDVYIIAEEMVMLVRDQIGRGWRNVMLASGQIGNIVGDDLVNRLRGQTPLFNLSNLFRELLR